MLRHSVLLERKTAAVLATVLLASPFAAWIRAQSAYHPNAILVVLKNQPARHIATSLLSPGATAHKLAEADLRAAKQSGAAEHSRVKAGQDLLKALLARTKETAAEIRTATEAEQDFHGRPPVRPWRSEYPALFSDQH